VANWYTTIVGYLIWVGNWLVVACILSLVSLVATISYLAIAICSRSTISGGGKGDSDIYGWLDCINAIAIPISIYTTFCYRIIVLVCHLLL
jgi:ATP/ADP translocase